MRGNQISIMIQRMRYVATDLVTTALAIFAFNIFRYFLMEMHERGGLLLGEFLAQSTIIAEQILLPIGLLGIYWWSGYYNSPFSRSRVEEFQSTMISSVVSAALIYFSLLINDPLPARTQSYELLIVLWGCLFLFTYVGRLILTTSSIRHLRERDWFFNTIIVGDSDHALSTASRLENLPTNLGYNIVGHVHIEGEQSASATFTVLDDGQVDRLARTHNIDQIVLVPLPGTSEEKVMQLLFKYFSTGVPVRMAPTSLAFLTSHIRLGDIISEPMIDLTAPAMNELQRNTKRIMDVLFSAAALLLLSPLYLALAILVKTTSKGPVIYRQERVGYRQKPFRILKFRSMRVDAEANGPQLSDETDPRITPLGKVMRKYRLDELPQFWNVLKGDMSLVGPRPERAYFIEQIVREAPYYTLIHQVKPGITSWGMVKFGYARSVAEMVERTRYDLIYLSNMSVGVDIKILLHTIKTVLMGRGL